MSQNATGFSSLPHPHFQAMSGICERFTGSFQSHYNGSQLNSDDENERHPLLGTPSRSPTKSSVDPQGIAERTTDVLARVISYQGTKPNRIEHVDPSLEKPTLHFLKGNTSVQEIIREFAKNEDEMSRLRGYPRRKFDVDITPTGFLVSRSDRGGPNNPTGVPGMKSRVEATIPFSMIVFDESLATRYYNSNLAHLRDDVEYVRNTALKEFVDGTQDAPSTKSDNLSLTTHDRKTLAKSSQMQQMVDHAAGSLLKNMMSTNHKKGRLPLAYLPGYSFRIVSDEEDEKHKLYLRMAYTGGDEAVSGDLPSYEGCLGDAASFLEPNPPPSCRYRHGQQPKGIPSHPSRTWDLRELASKFGKYMLDY
nr:hypothetical protein L203_06123 [Cryptococcus depauperatus CBS 7841]